MAPENSTASSAAAAPAAPTPATSLAPATATPAPATPFMNGNVIDGKAVAAKIREETAAKVAELKAKYNRVPGLAVVIVGQRKDSQTYVRMKRKACEEVGIASFGADLPDTATQEEVLSVVRGFNANPDVHGILVQLPLPKHIDEQAVLGAISVEKDVDGFHPLNIGRLAMKGREPLFAPCTPVGCMELLERCGIPIKGKRAVVVGRSNIVGMPAALLLNKRDATVTICHSATKDMESIVRQADIIIAAAGQAQLVRGSWVKPGAAIIDVGTNPVDDKTKSSGYRLVGDAHFEECKEVAGAITPVPGGVGPMTIAILLKNTLESGERFISGKLQSSAAPSKRGQKGALARLLPEKEHLGPLSALAAVSLVAGAALQRIVGGVRQ
ncbi:Bifunctional protein FolD 2 [Pleodorina starrii]|uniref:Bifunctional protein FolD 2 n=1 Tax=Pleodorina starrii TaxID=330485 RepID=A0A9W6BHJ6_9CHLO|nr:Bifunctional protein FolD 2 [Pleodorina starrii]GLC51727.1 Bifunctional protein FolD 2 [Pleodorina starrii]GLC72499.1 Bifunctional protein FolD 2 [Pleodorina starrii]